MKFNASTDPKLSTFVLTSDQLVTANLLAMNAPCFDEKPDAMAREIIALRAALESHAESLRKARLAAWEAGRTQAGHLAVEMARREVVEDRDEDGAVCAVYETEASAVASGLATAIMAIRTPTPEELETMT